jgi:hypothetical protein
MLAGTTAPWCRRGTAATMPSMNKRIAAAVLWFFAGWYLGGYIALFLGISDLIGPILAISAALLFAGDPLGLIWSGQNVSADEAPAQETVVEELAQAA